MMTGQQPKGNTLGASSFELSSASLSKSPEIVFGYHLGQDGDVGAAITDFNLVRRLFEQHPKNVITTEEYAKLCAEKAQAAKSSESSK